MFYNKFVLKNKSNFPLFTLYLRINEYIFIQFIRPYGGVKAFSFSLIIIEHSLYTTVHIFISCLIIINLLTTTGHYSKFKKHPTNFKLMFLNYYAVQSLSYRIISLQ